MAEKKDLIIIGGSAAGAAAAVYAARRKFHFELISDDFGGEMARSGKILNYPGFPETDGIELSEKFLEHIKANDVEPQLGILATGIDKRGEGDFVVHAKKGEENLTFKTKSVIVATGVHPRKLGVPGEEELAGKGVTYCTTCDGPLFRGKRVTTLGAGSAGLESVLMLAEIADEVTLFNKYADFSKAEKVLVDKVLASDKIRIIYNAQTTKVNGDMKVESLEYRDSETGEKKIHETDGVFIHIGTIPNSGFVPESVIRDQYKSIEVNLKCETSVSGIFAAGDVTNIPYNQIAIASGQGVTAALTAIDYVNKLV